MSFSTLKTLNSAIRTAAPPLGAVCRSQLISPFQRSVVRQEHRCVHQVMAAGSPPSPFQGYKFASYSYGMRLKADFRATTRITLILAIDVAGKVIVSTDKAPPALGPYSQVGCCYGTLR